MEESLEGLILYFFSNGNIYSFEEEVEAESIRLMPDGKNRMYLIKAYEVIYGKRFPIETGFPFYATADIPEFYARIIVVALSQLGGTRRSPASNPVYFELK